MAPKTPNYGFERSQDRKSTRLNSSHTEIYTLSLHDALPICFVRSGRRGREPSPPFFMLRRTYGAQDPKLWFRTQPRSEEHTSELQSHRDLHSFPTRRSSDLFRKIRAAGARAFAALFYAPEDVWRPRPQIMVSNAA